MSTVHESKAALGARLREVRKDAGLTGRRLAERAEWHPSKISKIEYGKQNPSEDDLRVWCELCESSDQLPDLVATLRGVESAYLEWKRQLRTGLKRKQQISRPLYLGAKVIRAYEPGLIPGLLQTAAYAEGVMGSFIHLLEIPDDRAEAVPARMERQRVLYEGDRRFVFILEEAALRTLVGGPEVMLGQLDRLLAVMSLHRVGIGIIPAVVERHIWPGEGFLMFDNATVQVETVSAQLTITQPQEVRLYAKTFEWLQQSAVLGEQARALISRAIDDLRAI